MHHLRQVTELSRYSVKKSLMTDYIYIYIYTYIYIYIYIYRQVIPSHLQSCCQNELQEPGREIGGIVRDLTLAWRAVSSVSLTSPSIPQAAELVKVDLGRDVRVKWLL